MTASNPSWTRRLAEFIVDADTAAAPASVHALALGPIVDTIACMMAGLDSDAGAAVLDYAGFDRAMTLAGLWGAAPTAGSSELRALVGATAGAALDYDDVSAIGHPSSILIAAILSSRQPRLTGADVLDAYLIGYEVTTRLGQAMMLPHTRYGWHATSTTGFFGALAVTARLDRMSVEQVEHGLGIAASMAAGIGRNFGTMTKPLHSGLAARGGYAAARLAQAGIVAGRDVLDGPRGYLDMYALGESEPARLAGLGAPWAMAERPPSLKKFAACYATHREIDAVLQIQREHRFAADDVEQIIVRAPARATGGLTYSRPTTGLEAKFSGTYPAVAALLDGKADIGTFTTERVMRPVVRHLLERVDIAEDPRCRPEDPEGVYANPIEGGFWEVTILAKDGRSGSARSYEAPGSGSRLLEWPDIRDKFLDCAAHSGVTVEAAGTVFDRFRELPAVPDVRALLVDLDEGEQPHLSRTA